MRTAEEIKKGLEHCCNDAPCVECEYYDQRDRRYTCEDALLADALAYIQQLEMLAKPSEQVRWERDVAIDQLKQLGVGFGEKAEAQVPKWISVDERLPEVRDLRGECTACIHYHDEGPFDALRWKAVFMAEAPVMIKICGNGEAHGRCPVTDHLYYVVSPSYHAPTGATMIDVFTEPYYESAIDRMIYGVIIYDHPLTPAEIAGSGLVSLPRDCDSEFSDFANRIGVSRSTICNYEKGRRNNITTPVLRAIAKALDVDVNDLKGGY